MSLVPTWVYAEDGNWYKDPVITGPGWFICFDDDDPPEMVIRTDQRQPQIPAFFQPIGKFGHPCHRHFNNGFFPAKSCFGRLEKAIPVPQQFRERIAGPDWPHPPFGECSVDLNRAQRELICQEWLEDHPGLPLPVVYQGWLKP